MFEPFSSDFKTILTGSSFCTFGRVMYKTKTLVKFVDNCKSCTLFLVSASIENHVRAFFLSDFKTILTGSSFLDVGGNTFPLVNEKDRLTVLFLIKK